MMRKRIGQDAWKKILQAVIKEMHLLMALHRRTVMIMVAVPLVYTVLFGALFYENAIEDVPILVCNRDEGEAGRKLVRDLATMPDIRIEERLLDEGDEKDLVQNVMDAGAVGVVVIPAHFSRDIACGEPVSVAFLVDNSNTTLGGTAAKAVQSVVAQWDASVQEHQRRAAGWTSGQTGSLDLAVRVIGNPTGGYEDFFLVILILHAAQIGIVFSLGPSMVLDRKRRRKHWERHTLSCLLAKFLVSLPLSLLILCVCFALSMWGLSLINRSDYLSLILLLSAYLSAIVAFALCVGSWVRKAEQAITYVLVYIMPSVLFSGAIWPRYDMDTVSLAISYIVPIGYVAEDFRNLLLLGDSPGWLWHAGILFLIAGLFLGLACLGIRQVKEKDTAEKPVGMKKREEKDAENLTEGTVNPMV